MVSREKKAPRPIYKKLQLLRSLTRSHTHSESSIISNASKCIEGLKEKVEEMKQEINIEQPSTTSFPIPVEVKVETQESGFHIKVITEETCRGLLVFILEAFEELGLDVLQARVSCSHNFHLEALGIIVNKIRYHLLLHAFLEYKIIIGPPFNRFLR
ncbi:hypothetical protein UlMin_013020 [Ulmus minor]